MRWGKKLRKFIAFFFFQREFLILFKRICDFLKRNGVFGKRIEIFVPKKVDTLPKRIENRTSVFYLIVNVN